MMLCQLGTLSILTILQVAGPCEPQHCEITFFRIVFWRDSSFYLMLRASESACTLDLGPGTLKIFGISSSSWSPGVSMFKSVEI